MQQMAGNMGLLNPFVLNQFSVPNGYGPYSQVEKQKLSLTQKDRRKTNKKLVNKKHVNKQTGKQDKETSKL